MLRLKGEPLSAAEIEAGDPDRPGAIGIGAMALALPPPRAQIPRGKR
jgi:hypothetical protein